MAVNLVFAGDNCRYKMAVNLIRAGDNCCYKTAMNLACAGLVIIIVIRRLWILSMLVMLTGSLLHELSNDGARQQFNAFLDDLILPQMVSSAQVILQVCYN